MTPSSSLFQDAKNLLMQPASTAIQKVKFVNLLILKPTLPMAK
jgi:hypothetical protein